MASVSAPFEAGLLPENTIFWYNFNHTFPTDIAAKGVATPPICAGLTEISMYFNRKKSTHILREPGLSVPCRN